MDRLSFLGKRHSPPSSCSSWTVVRLGAKDVAARQQEGDVKSCQRKTACDTLTIRSDGVQGVASFSWWNFFTAKKRVIQDYNHYRSQGHSGRFDAGTNDRAVSVATVAAYTTLETALGCRVTYGDLGDNVLLDGPPAAGDAVLSVGQRIRLGPMVVLEITEANNPCYRFNSQTWAAVAREKWGESSPEGPDHWFKSPECPLNHKVNPGIRGYLAKVIAEGDVAVGDVAGLVSLDGDGDKETKEARDLTSAQGEDDDAQPSPTKKRKTDKAKENS